jgi:hypothetical protein
MNRRDRERGNPAIPLCRQTMPHRATAADRISNIGDGNGAKRSVVCGDNAGHDGFGGDDSFDDVNGSSGGDDIRRDVRGRDRELRQCSVRLATPVNRTTLQTSSSVKSAVREIANDEEIDVSMYRI